MNYYLFEHLAMRNLTKSIEYYNKYYYFINRENKLISPDAYIEDDGIALFEESNVIDYLNSIDKSLAPSLLKNGNLLCLNNLNITKKNIPGNITKEKIVNPTAYNFIDYLNSYDLETLLKFNSTPRNIKKFLENPKKLTDSEIDAISTAWQNHLSRRFTLQEVTSDYLFELSDLEKIRMSAFAIVGGIFTPIFVSSSSFDLFFQFNEVKVPKKNKNSISQFFIQKEESNE